MTPDYLLTEYEVWIEGPARTLRLTTDLALPFGSSALLKARLTTAGLLLCDKAHAVMVLLTPGLEGEALRVFHESCPGQGLLLTEMHFSQDAARNWLVLRE